MAHRYFEGIKHAEIYAKYRPIPPENLIKSIICFLKEKCPRQLSVAFDVGCGSGQSTGFLAPYFEKVVGTDISSSQITKAIELNSKSNVKFSVHEAENIPAEDGSVQLITVSQAAHWFNLPLFYKEVNRVLCNGGVLSMYGYELPKFIWKKDPRRNMLLDAAMRKIFETCLWDERRKLVDQRYSGLKIPLNDFIRDDSFYHDASCSLLDVAMYCTTWSGYQKFVTEKGTEAGEKLIQSFLLECLDALGEENPDKLILIKRTYFFLLMGRKSA